MVFLEICLDSFESAEAAVQGGAKRLEVCSSLPQGGLTPTTGLLKHIKSEFPEVIAFCMLRPRGGDFVYTKDELKTILMDCEELKKSGADGFVFGALTPDGSLDEEACKAVLQACAPYPVTFHRAIDYARDWKAAIQTVAHLGFKYVLSSGQQPTAMEGLAVLREMVATGAITVIAGSGVHPGNVRTILGAIPAIGGVHSSASWPKVSQFTHKVGTFMMGSLDQVAQYAANPQLVGDMVEAVNDAQ